MEIREQMRTVPPDLVVEPLLRLLDETPVVPLVISGGSMTPFLVPGRDVAYLSKVTCPLQRGDMVLYRRINGRYVLHRIVRVDADSYTMLGDAQTAAEPGIRSDQILAVVTSVRRKGKLLEQGSFWWFFFKRVWVLLVPLRPLIRSIYDALKKRV